jgi:hypothetical protein
MIGYRDPRYSLSVDTEKSVKLSLLLHRTYAGAGANVLLTAFVGVHSTVGSIFCPYSGST